MDATTHPGLLSTYEQGEHLPDPLPEDPFPLVQAWFDEAQERHDQPNTNAMTLATVTPDGRPSARIVLCKGLDPEAGVVVFYSNYRSRKGADLAANPYAALVMHWDHADRQVRLEGRVTRSPAEESDAYFASRRWESRLGAWSSEQSRPIESREKLLEQVAEKTIELGLDLVSIVDGGDAGVEIPRPPHWGGYRVWVERVELWCSGVGRVHDRGAWRRELTETAEGYVGGVWRGTRLQP